LERGSKQAIVGKRHVVGNPAKNLSNEVLTAYRISKSIDVIGKRGNKGSIKIDLKKGSNSSKEREGKHVAKSDEHFLFS